VCNQRSFVKSEANSKEPSAHGYLQASRPPNLQHSSSTGALGHHDNGHSNSDKHISDKKKRFKTTMLTMVAAKKRTKMESKLILVWTDCTMTTI
jgi:hypothetical protein